jgi:hypothetical protein
MNSRFIISRPDVRLIACLWAVLWLAGCATNRVDWAARVGHYTYEQAVLEMGPPDKQAKLSDGTTVAEWLVNRGYTYVTGGPGPYGPFWGGGTATAYTTPSMYMRLTFGPNGQLTAWKKTYR